MADKPYKSNKKSSVKKEEPKKEVATPTPAPVADEAGVQIHFGNYKKIEMKLLEAIARNTYMLLVEFKKINEKLDKEQEK